MGGLGTRCNNFLCQNVINLHSNMGGLGTRFRPVVDSVFNTNLHSNMGGLGTKVLRIYVSFARIFTFQYGWIGYLIR